MNTRADTSTATTTATTMLATTWTRPTTILPSPTSKTLPFPAIS